VPFPEGPLPEDDAEDKICVSLRKLNLQEVVIYLWKQTIKKVV